jgi:Flp pilus assembly protein TadG
MRTLQRQRRSDTGAAAVEFALVSMILILLLLGIMQFGYLFYQWNEITHAAREGARWSALGKYAGTVDTEDTVRYYVAQAAPGMGLTDTDIDVSVLEPTLDDVGDPATVTVRWRVPIWTPLLQNLFNAPDNEFVLRSTATLRIE